MKERFTAANSLLLKNKMLKMCIRSNLQKNPDRHYSAVMSLHDVSPNYLPLNGNHLQSVGIIFC